jgi:hypothetical protein
MAVVATLYDTGPTTNPITSRGVRVPPGTVDRRTGRPASTKARVGTVFGYWAATSDGELFQISAPMIATNGDELYLNGGPTERCIAEAAMSRDCGCVLLISNASSLTNSEFLGGHDRFIDGLDVQVMKHRASQPLDLISGERWDGAIAGFDMRVKKIRHAGFVCPKCEWSFDLQVWIQRLRRYQSKLTGIPPKRVVFHPKAINDAKCRRPKHLYDEVPIRSRPRRLFECKNCNETSAPYKAALLAAFQKIGIKGVRIGVEAEKAVRNFNSSIWSRHDDEL